MLAKGQNAVPENSVVLLGAGIAGLAAADQLSRAGYAVTVIERSNRCGGTHRSHNIGPYTFDVGSIFYEDTAKIFAMDEGLKDRCPQVMRRQRRIDPSGNVLHYPIEPREILKGNPWRAPLGALSMAANRWLVAKDGTLEAICRKRLGDVFFDETGLRAYITRFHHIPPSEIDERFYFHRMRFIEKATRLNAMIATGSRSLFTRKTINAKTRRPLHIRPQSGYDAIFTPIRERLEARGVRFVFGEEMRAVRKTALGFEVDTNGGTHSAPSLVSTIPLPELYPALFGEECDLVLLNMTSLFVSAASLSEKTGNVLFNFHNDGLWKRATIYSRLYPDADTDRAFMGVEVTIPHGGNHDPETAFEDFRAHLTKLGLATDIRLEGHDLVEGCYPFYARGADAVLEEALARIAATGVVTVGRQGRFEYLPTSTGVIRRVGEELDAATDAGQLPSFSEAQ